MLNKKDLGNNAISREIVYWTYINNNGLVLFKNKITDRTTKRDRLSRPILILKPGKNKNLESLKAIGQFKDLIDRLPEKENEVIEKPNVLEGENDQYLKNYPLIEINKKKYEIGNKKLSFDEKKKILLASTDPPETIHISSRIGDNGALNIEANHFQETIDETNHPIKYKEVRYQQVEDISHLKRLKKWAKENIVSISVAGIIKVILVGLQKVVCNSAKAVYNLEKKG